MIVEQILKVNLIYMIMLKSIMMNARELAKFYYTESFNTTPKIHLKIHQYKFNFKKIGKKIKYINGEFGKTLHYTERKA